MQKRILYPFIFIVIFISSLLNVNSYIFVTDALGQTTTTLISEEESNWPMAGANPQRTSWTSEEVRGVLKPLWFKPFEPYISQKVQIIAANDMLFISTSKGLYALDAETGNEIWVYPTDLPLGHSPTIANGVAYVGGFDRKIHAINAITGIGLWTFEAGAGFHTNPLVVEDKVFAGNRDGYFYAVYAEGHPNAGELIWKYKTGGPILFSAAYKDNVVFFASNDNHAYALNAETGSVIWKSEKLPGPGFHSWWPVVYQDRVIFVGSNNTRYGAEPTSSTVEKFEIYPNREIDPRGTLIGPLGEEPGDWAEGTPTINASRVLEYFSEKPWRRTYFVLDRLTGQEKEIAPILWTGTASGTRYPPIVGGDGVLYQQNHYMSDLYIPGGNVSGWKIGTPYISVVSSGWGAVDEPRAYSAGGNLVYVNLCCDRIGAAFDVTIPNTVFADRYNSGIRPPTGGFDFDREWLYYVYNLDELLPGYNTQYHNPDTDYTWPYASFGGTNGVYGFHADTNPPVPYKGKVYFHRSNAIIAFGNQTEDPIRLPMADIIAAPGSEMVSLGSNHLKALLSDEIQNILNAGHLRPGYANHGAFNVRGVFYCGDDLVDYWHNSAETIYTLVQVLPHLSNDLQEQVKIYLQNEFTNYPPYKYNHIGWQDGAGRESFDLPSDVEADLINHPPKQQHYGEIWNLNPYGFYAMWKYAEVFGNAQLIFDASKDKLEFPPGDAILLEKPFVQNAYIAGYMGYLELEKLAGYPETISIRIELERLLDLRIDTFSKDSPYGNDGNSNINRAYCRTLNVSRNFMFLVPELSQYLRENALTEVQEALDEYYDIAPYWFVSFSDEGFAENAINPLYDAHSLFMAKALILQAPADELEKYLDVPAFERGDLYYIQKLVTLIETSDFRLGVEPHASFINSGETVHYTVDIKFIGDFTDTVALSATSPSPDVILNLYPTTISPPGGQAILTLTDTHPISSTASFWYTVPITATGGDIEKTTSIGLLVNGFQLYLPIIVDEN